MNYPAPSARYTPQAEEPSIRENYERFKARIHTVWGFISVTYEILISFPLLILNALGYDVVGTTFQWLCPLITVFVYGATFGIASSIGIAVGVGLGVGLDCAETLYYPARNTTNMTI